MTQDLSAWTPQRIDMMLVAIWAQHGATVQRLRKAEIDLRLYRAYGDPRWIAQAEQAMAQAREDLAKVTEITAPYDAEYERRPWTRAWKVVSSSGHIHSSADCPAIRPSTRLELLSNVSGLPEGLITGLAGDRTCTRCFDGVPAKVLRQPCRLLSRRERLAKERRVQREHKAEERRIKQGSKQAA